MPLWHTWRAVSKATANNCWKTWGWKADRITDLLVTSCSRTAWQGKPCGWTTCKSCWKNISKGLVQTASWSNWVFSIRKGESCYWGWRATVYPLKEWKLKTHQSDQSSAGGCAKKANGAWAGTYATATRLPGTEVLQTRFKSESCWIQVPSSVTGYWLILILVTVTCYLFPGLPVHCRL